MPPIRILPDTVANQIAAGEVIERPVAVVKELVENSLDAGADRIEVEFRNGGKSYIRVADNGRGMNPDDALLCLERHATSKISEAADLDRLASFGFRGEALPSIASVSRFTLCSRPVDSEAGTEVLVNGGKLIHRKECGMPAGTVVEVAQLFNSVPARRKFLKTDPTEAAHIIYTMRLFAVAHAGVSFRVIDGGRPVFQSPACADLRDRIREIWGPQLAEGLVPVDSVLEAKGYQLSGLTARPGVGRSTRREMVTLVNRRPVDSRTLGYAVLDAYHGRIQKGRFPPVFLFLDTPSSEVDVNVHPAKREVRFRDEGSIRRFVLGGVTEALEKLQTPSVAPAVEVPQGPATEKLKAAASVPVARPAPGIASPTPAPVRKPAASPQPAAQPTPEPAAPAAEHEPVLPAGWRFLTSLQRRYALFETPRGLFLLHLRRADERVRFESIRTRIDEADSPRQSLLIPEPVELEPLAAATLLEHADFLRSAGFEIEEFGRNFFRIEAVPAWLAPDRAEAFVRDYLELVRQRGRGERAEEFRFQRFAELATRDSYRRNDPVTDTEIVQLAARLLTCGEPHTSPSGKPTFTEVDWNEWERRLDGDRSK